MTSLELRQLAQNANPATRAAIERELAVKTRASNPCQPAPRQRSPLELRFIELWKSSGGPDLVEEHQFHPTRKWAFDFAHLPSFTAIEVEGGLYKGGRHQTFKGFTADAEKYLEAQFMGWRVMRLTTKQINTEVIRRIITAIPAGAGERSCK